MNNRTPITVSDLQTPCLVLYHSKIKRNAERMMSQAKDHGVQLRPHFKTTKCVQAAILQTAGTKQCMVVSTIIEAKVLLEDGFDDILLGVPLSYSKIQRCIQLTENMEKFCVMIDSHEIAEHLTSKQHLKNSKVWNVFLKVNCGYGRCGILHSSQKVLDVAKLLHGSPRINFCGLYAHCGDSYHVPGVAAIQQTANRTSENIINLKQKLESVGVECKTYGIGSTPTCSKPSEMMGQLTEWHPGNYILYDQMQVSIK